MVFPLSRGVGRGAISTVAAYGVKQGWGVNKIAAEMRRLGQGYRRTTMLGDIRAILGRERARPAAMAIPKKYRPSTAHFGLSEFHIKRQYQAAIEFRGINRQTGLPAVHTVYMEYDELPSLAEMEEEALERWGEEYRARLDMEIESWGFTGGYRRA